MRHDALLSVGDLLWREAQVGAVWQRWTTRDDCLCGVRGVCGALGGLWLGGASSCELQVPGEPQMPWCQWVTLLYLGGGLAAPLNPAQPPFLRQLHEVWGFLAQEEVGGPR